MAVSDFWTRVAKLRATIIECDPAQNTVDVRAGDGGTRRIMVWEVPSGFRWPVVGEDWSIYEQNGSWYLGDRINNSGDDHSITAMQPGDQRLDGDRIFDTRGDRIFPTNVASLDPGDRVIYDSVTDRMVAEPTFNITNRQVRDVGEVGQIMAGRPLTVSDFTRQGLNVPLGVWGCGDLLDTSGNGYNLSNKGSVQFVSGITGTATEAAQFTGSVAQALYISTASNSTAEAVLRLTALTTACWVRGCKRSTQQTLVTKLGGTAGTYTWELCIQPTDVPAIQISADGTNLAILSGATDVCDDRWHWIGFSFDGNQARLYVDGVRQGSMNFGSSLNTNAAPFNIGARSGDAATASAVPYFGRIDEVFITTDILSDEQMRNLYCVRIPHTWSSAPSGIKVNVQRQRRGAQLTTANIPNIPIRIHNLNGTYADLVSGGVTLTPNPGSGSITDAPGPAGLKNGSKRFTGAHNGLSASDTGLVINFNARSMGAWFKTNSAATATIMSYGTVGTGEASIFLGAAGVYFQDGPSSTAGSGPFPSDGTWHHVVAVVDVGSFDGLKVKTYLDGRVVGTMTTFAATVLGGANRYRIGARTDGTVPWAGNISRAFVYAGALTPESVRALYNLGTQPQSSSPKSEGDHVMTMESDSLLVTFDTLEGCDLVNLKMSR